MAKSQFSLFNGEPIPGLSKKGCHFSLLMDRPGMPGPSVSCSPIL